MRRCSRLFAVVAIVLLGLITPGMTADVRAQDARPAAGLGTPAPLECTVEPRPLAFFEQFVGTPTAEQEAAMMGATEATPDPAFRMPEGDPADEATVAAVVETVWQLGACINAGDFGRYAATFTEDYHQREFARFGPIPEEEMAAFTATTPATMPEAQRVALLAVVEVRVMADGRVAWLFDVDDPFAEPPGPARIYWELVEEDGRWLIDEEIMLGPVPSDQIGTPTG